MKKLMLMLVLLLVAGSLVGGTKYRRVRFAFGWDSVMVFYRANAGDSVGDTLRSFPHQEDIALDDTKGYDFEFLYWENSDTLVSVYSSDQWRYPGSMIMNDGGGDMQVDIYAYDTANGAVIPGVQLKVKNDAATLIGDRKTTDDGYARFWLDSLSTYHVTATLSGFGIDSAQLTVASDTADTAYGYSLVLNAPGTPKTCRVAINVVNNDGSPAEGVEVTAHVNGYNIVDSLGSAVNNRIQYKDTDASGQVWFDCIWSSYFIPATDWLFEASGPAIGSIWDIYTVPRQDTVTISMSAQ